MTSRFILVDDSLVRNGIYRGNGCLERSLCNGFIGGVDGFSNVLDRSAQLGAQAHVAVTLTDILPCTFSRLRTICHKKFLNEPFAKVLNFTDVPCTLQGKPEAPASYEGFP